MGEFWRNLLRRTDDEDARYVDPTGPSAHGRTLTRDRSDRARVSSGASAGCLRRSSGHDLESDSAAQLRDCPAATSAIASRRPLELSGFALGSRVEGSAEAIRAIRLDPRHGYGRPDLPNPDDSTTSQTSLTGGSAQARIARVAGSLLWDIAGRVVTPGFEMNDQGFQRNANWCCSPELAVLVYRLPHDPPVMADRTAPAPRTAGLHSQCQSEPR
jgi:hypothetical protein